MNPKTIIIMGKSGAGKGTQIKKIREYLGDQPLIYVETGTLIRNFIKKESYAAKRAK